jgi:hypothetical protein
VNIDNQIIQSVLRKGKGEVSPNGATDTLSFTLRFGDFAAPYEVTGGEHVARQSIKLINPTGLRKLSGIARATAWSIADCETLAGK